jgi:hypothetical protein
MLTRLKRAFSDKYIRFARPTDYDGVIERPRALETWGTRFMRAYLSLLSASLLIGAALSPSAAADTPSTPSSAPEQLAARIDELISAKLRAKGIQPASISDDAEFLRRVSLDIVGRIPRAFEVRDFLDDATADKRKRLVERFLEHPGYVNHFANVWRDLLLPQVNNPEVQRLIPSFEDWLRPRIRDNVHYDELIRELLTASPSMPAMRRRNNNGKAEPTPAAFYQANELKPENLAGNTSRLLLGVKLECAQCHDHPHAKWIRKQFWEYAAFFADVPARAPGDQVAVKIPGSDRPIEARFLDGSQPSNPGRSPRKKLAEWMTNAKNPYFARAAVNRLWAQFFGIGIVEPVDDLGEQNPPSHPELLNELATQFAANHFDVKYLIRAITLSQTYQRSSVAAEVNKDDARLFAHMSVRGLSPEQLFDSLLQATGARDTGNSYSQTAFYTARAEFVVRFTNQEKRTEYQTSILQALTLMNGKLVDGATSLERSETLAAVIDAPFFDDAQKIEALFLATLSRKPTPAEADHFVQYISKGGAEGNLQSALGDVFWALLNSAEFMLNH